MSSNIRLYYVPGLTRKDEVLFSNDDDQFDYFSRYLVSSPVDGFYPPHFKDTIAISSTNIALDSRCNYCSLYFLENYYWYFIDSVEYVSETLVRLHISLDVIQTYHLDWQFKKFHRMRESIKRWIEDENHNILINRDYIRENVSSGVFEQYDRVNFKNRTDFTTSLNGGNITGLYIAKCNQDSEGLPDWLLSWEKPVEISQRLPIPSHPKITSYNPYFLYMIPEIDGKLYRTATVTAIRRVQHGTTFAWESTTEVEDFYQTIQDISKKPRCVELYYLPLTYPIGIKAEFPGGATTPTVTCTDDWAWVDEAGLTGAPTSDRLCEWPFEPCTYLFNAPFTRNTSNTSAFSSSYCPQMLDPNYITFSFGEAGAQSTFPSHLSEAVSFRCVYFGDVGSGGRYYNTMPNYMFDDDNNFSAFENTYYTMAVAQNPHFMDLLTDAWLQWWEYNKATLFVTVGVTAVKCASAWANYASLAEASQNVTNARYHRDYHYRASRRVDWREGEYSKARLKARRNEETDAAAYSAINTGMSAMNAMFQPDIPKTSGTKWANLLSGNSQISLLKMRVIDFDECAKYFETEGYLVNKEVTGNGIIPSNRYYYDVVCCNELCFTLINFPLTNELHDELISRFEEGFRVWHTYKDNNVVKARIEDRSLILGATCVYDNLEV